VEVSIGTAILFFAYEVPAIAIKKVLFEQADRAIYKAKENVGIYFLLPLI
jgi:GGDEF domain-containing protein